MFLEYVVLAVNTASGCTLNVYASFVQSVYSTQTESICTTSRFSCVVTKCVFSISYIDRINRYRGKYSF